MAVSLRGGWESSSCSVREPGCPTAPTWHGRTGGFLETCWSWDCCNPKEIVSNAVEEMPQEHDRMTCQWKGGQTGKITVSFFGVLLYGLPPEVWTSFRVGHPASNNLTKKIPHKSAQHFGFWFLVQSGCQPRLAITVTIVHLWSTQTHAHTHTKHTSVFCGHIPNYWVLKASLLEEAFESFSCSH